MYTGRTEQPCALCGARETATRIDVPPRAVALMRNAEPIAVRDIVGTASVHFCADDWETVEDIVIDLGGQPLSRCNAAYASFSIREDYEALLNQRRDEPDQRALERRLRSAAADTLDARDESVTERRDIVEALVVRRALAKLETGE